MTHFIITIFFSILLMTILILCFIKSKKISKKHNDKIDTLVSIIDKMNKQKSKIKIKSYSHFFKIVRHIFTHFKPETISVYYYDKKPELKTTIMNFLYQIKNDGGDGSIAFTGQHNNIPITNLRTISKSYFQNDIITINDINELCDYDNGLYEHLTKSGIKTLYLVNIYSDTKNIKPIGFFALTYKNKILNKDEKFILLNETKKISKSLKTILK